MEDADAWAGSDKLFARLKDEVEAKDKLLLATDWLLLPTRGMGEEGESRTMRQTRKEEEESGEDGGEEGGGEEEELSE